VAIPHPTVFVRSAATWQSPIQPSSRGAQRRGNPHPTVFARSAATRQSPIQPSLRGAQRRGNPHPTVFARSAATWQSPIQPSLRGAAATRQSIGIAWIASLRSQRRGKERSDAAIPNPTVFARSTATWQSIGISCGDGKHVAMWFFYQGASTE
jgi:hypothetical protein